MRAMGLLGVTLLALLASGCLVEVREVRDPGPAFDDAREEAQRAEDRGGRAHTLHVLAWEPDDRKLVRLSIPLWLAVDVHAHGHADIHIELDDCEKRVAHTLRRHLHRRDLERGRAGILVDVEEGDGERALVWLR